MVSTQMPLEARASNSTNAETVSARSWRTLSASRRANRIASKSAAKTAAGERPASLSRLCQVVPGAGRQRGAVPVAETGGQDQDRLGVVAENH